MAIEHPTVTEIQVDLIKDWTISNPRVESENSLCQLEAEDQWKMPLEGLTEI